MFSCFPALLHLKFSVVLQEGDGDDLDIALVKRYGSVNDEDEVISSRTQPCNCSLERDHVPRTNYFT